MTDSPTFFNDQFSQGEPSMDSDTGSNQGFGGGYSDFVVYGLYNGAFASGPPDPTQNIDPFNASGSNFMPNWRFVQSSNTNITASQVRDTSSPSGSNFRFTYSGTGNAGDAAYIEQIVDIGGTRGQSTGAVVRAWAKRVSGANVDLNLEAQYLTADYTLTGNRTISSAFFTPFSPTGGYIIVAAHSASLSPPANAKYLRVRLIAFRTSGTAAASIDVTDVRLERSVSGVTLGERFTPGSYAAGYIVQQSGLIYITPDAPGLPGTNTNLVVGRDFVEAHVEDNNGALQVFTGHFRVPEITAPSTPSSGFYAIYAKSDSHLYGKNDAGTEVQIDGGGTNSPPTVQIFTANATWTKPAACVGAIVECVGSGGGSGSTSTTAAGQASASGGGGGGGYCKTWFAASALAATESITIGNGGAKATGPGNVSGSAGGDAVFAVAKAYIMTASGGGGGGGGTASAATVIRAGGAGGAATGGDVNIAGNDGYYGTVTGGSVFVAGYGAGAAGPYSSSTRPTSTTTTAAGNAGSSYGGGASGASTQASQTGQDGAAGAKGVVIVTEFY